MSPVPGIVADVFGELGKTAKQTGKQAVKLPVDFFETGGRQVKGTPVNDGGDGLGSGIEKTVASSASDTNPKKLTDQQKEKLSAKQQLELKKQEDRQKSRARYSQILNELQRYRQNKAEETPAYEAGKPGAPKDKKEEIGLWQEQRDKEEDEKKNQLVRLPGQQGGAKGTGERLKGITG